MVYGIEGTEDEDKMERMKEKKRKKRKKRMKKSGVKNPGRKSSGRSGQRTPDKYGGR